MAIDLTNLTQTELLQLVNATPLGTVLTRSRLRRQMDAAALRFGDGTRIHFVKYVRWLVLEHDRPRAKPLDYEEQRRRKTERGRAATKASQDIAPIPEVEDYPRRQACRESFRQFCETYFAAAFYRAWSEDHLRVIAKIEKAVREGGLFAFAMPRGSGKTTLARTAALWAVLYGYRPFVCLIGAADDRAKELLLPVKKHALENLRLLADFPEAVYPLRCLENSSKRQLQQHCRGRLTHVHWGQGKLVFPTLEGDDLPAALRQDGREAFERMIHEAENGRDFDAVLVYNISRFSRGGSTEMGFFLYRLQQAGVRVIFCAEALPDDDGGELLLGVKSWQARQYCVKLSRDCIRGAVSSIKVKQSAPGGRAPYGYDRQYRAPDGQVLRTIRHLPDGRKQEFDAQSRHVRFIPGPEGIGKVRSDIVRYMPGDPEHIKTVQRIFDLCARGYGFRYITIALNNDGVASPTGGRWNHRQVKLILANPAYPRRPLLQQDHPRQDS